MTTVSKKRILFVDDDRNILDGLKRILRPMRNEWDIYFVQSGENALELLEHRNIDVLISDMQMVGMNGIELLDKVKERYPRIVRIAFSGTAEQEVIMKSVCVAHQYLTKPCNSETLKNTVERACRLWGQLHDDSLKKIVSQIESLPSPPALYFEIMRELRSADPSIKKVAQTVTRDPSMCAKVLQIVNSAYFGLKKNVSDPEQAVNLLGIDVVKSLVLSVKAFSKMQEDKFPPHFVDSLWKHSAIVGGLARRIAKQENLNQQIIDDAYVAGLLHDIGKLILAEALPEKYGDMLATLQNKMYLCAKTERAQFGHTHAETGGYLLDLWGLPGPVVEAVTFHHTPSLGMSEGFMPLSAVHVADTIVWFQQKHGDECQDDPTALQSLQLWDELDLDIDYLTKLNLLDRLPEWVAIYKELEEPTL